MSYKNLKCQCCGKELNEGSLFGWVNDKKQEPVNIYDFVNIPNPYNLECCMVYCNDCTSVLDNIIINQFRHCISDWHLSWISDPEIYNDVMENKLDSFKKDYMKIYKQINC